MSTYVNFLNSWPESLDWKYHIWKKPQTQSLTNQNWRIPQSYFKKNRIMKFEKKISHKKGCWPVLTF
jgi:hypothetical protein